MFFIFTRYSWPFIGAPYTHVMSSAETYSKLSERQNSLRASSESTLASTFLPMRSSSKVIHDKRNTYEDEMDHEEFKKILHTLSLPYVTGLRHEGSFSGATQGTSAKNGRGRIFTYGKQLITSNTDTQDAPIIGMFGL